MVNALMMWVVEVAGLVSAMTVIVVAVKKLGKQIRFVADGQRCSLRSDMLHTYYKHHDDKTIRQYEFENFITSYEAYKALGGNSFIDKIYAEINEWEVIS